MTLTTEQQKLFEFVKRKHGQQLRKYTNDPYHTHLLNVAQIVSRFIKEDYAIEIALCHDLFEDTECAPEELVKALVKAGYIESRTSRIINGVLALTDEYTKLKYPNMNRFARKTLECVRLSKIDPLFQSVKYADLIDNTSSIVAYDPGFAVTYLKEKKAILNEMRQGNIDLFIEVCCTLRCAEDSLKSIPA